MRKDLMFRYLNSAISNLNRIHMHLLNQESNETFVQTSETNNGIEKEFQSATLTQVELDFIESQLENILSSVRILKEDFRF